MLFHGGDIDIRKGMKIPLPYFRGGGGTKGALWLRGEGGGTFLVLTFASFQSNEPRGKWKSKTKGVREG